MFNEDVLFCYIIVPAMRIQSATKLNMLRICQIVTKVLSVSTFDKHQSTLSVPSNAYLFESYPQIGPTRLFYDVCMATDILIYDPDSLSILLTLITAGTGSVRDALIWIWGSGIFSEFTILRKYGQTFVIYTLF